IQGSVSGSCAAILRTRGLMVNVTSTISSSVGSQSAAQRTHLYSACFTVLSVAPESRMPPQAGQRMFQDISKMPSRAPCRKAAITSSSLSLCLAAKARALIRQRSRSGASSMSFSIALTGFGFAGKFHVTIRLITVAKGELRLGNVQVLADFSCKKIDDLAMPRNCGRLLRATIDINRVIATFTQEFAAMLLEV